MRQNDAFAVSRTIGPITLQKIVLGYHTGLLDAMLPQAKEIG